MPQTNDNAHEKLAGSAMNARDMIRYQKDSIVSQTIIDTKGGTITLFAFEAGQRLSEHTAPFDALIYIVEGEAQVRIGGKDLKLEKDEMIVLPANAPHAVRALQRFKMLITMIRS